MQNIFVILIVFFYVFRIFGRIYISKGHALPEQGAPTSYSTGSTPPYFSRGTPPYFSRGTPHNNMVAHQ